MKRERVIELWLAGFALIAGLIVVVVLLGTAAADGPPMSERAHLSYFPIHNLLSTNTVYAFGHLSVVGNKIKKNNFEVDLLCDEQDGCYQYADGCEERDYYCAGNGTGCNYTSSNRYTDSWVDTGNTRWVDENECEEKEQKEQEYRDYKCSEGSCKYSINDTKWVDTGIYNSTCIDVSLAPLKIIFFTPLSYVDDTIGNGRAFSVTANQAANVSWYLNDMLVLTNESVLEAKCMLLADVVGEHNVTAIASNANGSDMQMWIWAVTEPPKECEGTDTCCGIYPNCENCNEQDGCYQYADGCEERDYYCAGNGTGCNYTSSNRYTDSWADTGNTRWVDVNECEEKEQKEQEYRDYKCSAGSCNYSINDTKWIDTGIYNSTCIDVSLAPLKIIFFTPLSYVDDTVGNGRAFSVTANQAANVSWYLNDMLVLTNESVLEAKCMLLADVVGEHNVTAIASNANGSDMQMWIWNVTELPKECEGTDTCCGIYPNCENCNEQDGCYPYGDGCEGRDYYCAGNGTGCNYTSSNRHNDSWADTGNTRWVDENECKQKEQKEQEYRDYKCSEGYCNYSINDTKWIDTGIYNSTCIGVSLAPPGITSFAPLSYVDDTVGNERTFNVMANQAVNVSWYLNDMLVLTNESVLEAKCTLHADVVGEHNVTAIASNANGSDMQMWIWNVTELPKECECTNTSCGSYPNCENCNEQDGCYPYGDGCEGRDYYCAGNGTGCNYTSSNRHNDSWVDTGNTRWVDENECKQKEQKEQDYRDYECSAGSCNYSINDTKWLDTGNTSIKANGTICGCTANNTVKRCYDGNCTDTGIGNTSNCSADVACDGKKANCTCGDICVITTGWWSAGGAFHSSDTPIQAAIDNATAGETICVKDGTYTENVDVDTQLTIRSENGAASTTVNALYSNDHVFEVTADYVSISGFTVNGATGSGKAGIYLDNNIGHCNIYDNNASGNYYGIYLSWSSKYHTITGNTVSNNDYGGIYLSSSSSNTITDNTASNNNYGIRLSSSSSNTITDNTASNNDWCGIRLSSTSNNNRIYNNYFNNIRNNAQDDGSNIWNITPTLGENIIGGSWLGGNYWSDYAGIDANGDGLGDTLLPYNSNGEILVCGDMHPLVPAGIAPLLSVEKTDDPDPVQPGGTLNYSISVSNKGYVYASAVIVTEIYDVNVTFDSAIPAPSSGNDMWIFPALNANETKRINISVTVNPLTTMGTVLHNTVNVSCAEGVTDTDTEATSVFSEEPNCTCGDICVITTGWWRDGGAFHPTDTPIQDAIDNATAGETICVKDGEYKENVDVDRQLTIRSENGAASTTVNALYSNDHVFEVTADYVSISGFTVNGATGSGKAGIYLDNNIGHCNIYDNNASGNYYGIYLSWSSKYHTITGNTVSNNDYGGIYLSSSSSNTITDNTASNNNYGIRLSSSSSNTITDNTASNNDWCGIRLSSTSNNNRIYNNYFNNIRNNAQDDGSNIWNITPTLGENIIGGSWLGGNYWSDYNGIDTNGDGLGDTLLPYNSNGDILVCGDMHPLVPAGIAPLLSVEKTDDPDPVQPGGTLNYSISVSNKGYVYASAVIVTEIYDVNVTFDSAIPAPSSGNDMWIFPALNANETKRINISVTVNPLTTMGTVLHNTVNVSCAEGVTDTDTEATSVFSEEPNCTCGDICVITTGWWRDGGAFHPTDTPIQDAIDNATAGETICVKDGEYKENVDVDRQLTIRSENGAASTTVNALYSNDHVFEVTADYVSISGFTVNGATGSGKAGIYLDNNIGHCNIYDNNASGNYYGIYLSWSSKYHTITGNTVSNNDYGGIYLSSSSSNTITDNTASNNNYGIRLSSSSSNTITDNTASNNDWCGIRLSSTSNNNRIYNNYFNNIRNNAQDDGSNIWNITPTLGENIIGGSWLGGNYWSDYNGIDTNGDGLGDTLLPYNSNGEILVCGDMHPLVPAGIAPLLSVEKTDDPDPVQPGGTLNYSISVSNKGYVYASAVIVTEIYDVNVTFDSAIPAPSSGNDMWIFPALNANETKRINISVTVNPLTAMGSVLHNTVTVSCAEGVTDTDTEATSVFSEEPNCTCGDICVITSGWWRDGGAFHPTDTPIQDAIDNATAGETICVKDGEYKENVDVDRQLTIRSENGAASTTVNALYSNDHVFEVTADYVSISGFTVKGATGSGKAGIWLDSNVDHCNIYDNNASDNNYGICLSWPSKYHTITGNTVSNNYDKGIYLGSSSNNTISGNTALNNYCGIFLSSSSNNTISDNTASNNYRCGIFLSSSSSNTIHSNTASNNGYGILTFSPSNNNLIYNNYFNNIWNNAHDDGTNIWNITKISGTNIIGGSWLGGNYWSDYNGIDTNGDGLGDTLLPYNANGEILVGGDMHPLVPAGIPLLSVEKTDDPDPVQPGGRLNYSISVSNKGYVYASAVTVTEIYDVNVTFDSAIPAPSSGNDMWLFPALNANETKRINISVTVNPLTAIGTVLHNTVTVSCAEGVTDTDTEVTSVFSELLSFTPSSHDFGDKYEGDTDSTTFAIWNSGAGTLSYSLSESCGWVEVNPTSGSSTGEHDTITVDIDTTGLSEGSYTCDITISSNGGSGTFTVTVNVVPLCTAKYAVYQAGVPDPEGILNPIRELRDDYLKDEYVDRYYDYCPELTVVVTRDPALAYEAARLLVKYSPMVKQEVYGIGMDKLITRGDVQEIVSVTNRLKREVMKNRDAIGVKSTEAIIDFIDEFEGQIKASEGKTFSAALKSSIYCESEPMAVATSDGTNFNTISGPATQKVLIGQNLQFTGYGSDVTVSRIVSGNVESVYQTDANNRIYNVNWPTSGAFFVNYDPALKLGAARISVENPVVPLELKVGTKRVSSIAAGTDLKVYTGGINLFDEDLVDLVIIGPAGQIKTDTKNNQQFTGISVAALGDFGDKLITNGWKIGDYTFQVKSKSANACGLSVSSDVKPLKILKGEISIDAEPTSTMELDSVTVTVTGVADDEIRVAADPCDGAKFIDGVEDTPTNAGCLFTDTIDSDGIRKYVIEFNDTGDYTIRVTVQSDPRAGDYDTVDITVSEKGVKFDLASTVVIGEKLDIKGIANTGTYVDVFIDDVLYAQLHNLVIEADGTFSKEVRTTDVGMTVPGPVMLKAWLDCAKRPGEEPPTTSADGSAAILVLKTHLDATISNTTVALGDSFEVFGNASSDYVEIVLLSPEGGAGTGMDGLYGTTIYTVPTYCNSTNYINNYYKKLKVDGDADSGNYTVIVLNPGKDKAYGDSEYTYIDSILDLDGEGPEPSVIDVSNRTQEQIAAIISDIIYASSSDDFMWIGNIVVA